MENKNIKLLYKICMGLILLASSIPLACGYIMEGGDVILWIHRIEEIKEGIINGELLFFPTASLIQQNGGWYSAFNSNIWLIFPALLRVMGMSITTVWRLYLLMLNIATIFSLRLFFKTWVKNEFATVFAVLLFMTSPYRIYICYDKVNLAAVIAWVFIPLALSGMLNILKKQSKTKDVLVTAIAMAAIGYADMLFFLITVAIGIIGVVWYRSGKGVVPIFLAGLIYLPGTICWMKYLFLGYYTEWGMPLKTISQEGYVLGQFFSSWTYRANCPGLGLGLLIGLLIWGWLVFINDEEHMLKENGFYIFVMLSTAIMSLQMFPWSVLQRVSNCLFRLIALMETPGMFFGFTILIASGLVALAIKHLLQKEEKILKVGCAVIIAFAALGTCVYICNTLTYFRIPLFL